MNDEGWDLLCGLGHFSFAFANLLPVLGPDRQQVGQIGGGGGV